MPRCMTCGKEYPKRKGGDILMSWCDECRAKPKPPDTYIRKNGLLIPNPEYAEYEKARQTGQETSTAPTTR